MYRVPVLYPAAIPAVDFDILFFLICMGEIIIMKPEMQHLESSMYDIQGHFGVANLGEILCPCQC